MEYLFIVVLILTIIIACALFFINKFNELNEISIKMNKAQDNISNLLQEKYSKIKKTIPNLIVLLVFLLYVCLWAVLFIRLVRKLYLD